MEILSSALMIAAATLVVVSVILLIQNRDIVYTYTHVKESFYLEDSGMLGILTTEGRWLALLNAKRHPHFKSIEQGAHILVRYHKKEVGAVLPANSHRSKSTDCLLIKTLEVVREF